MSLNDAVSGAIERVYRRILLMIGRGRVTIGNDSGNVQKLQMKLASDEIRDNTPRMAEFGFSSNPPVGSDAIVIFIGGDRKNGVIIATGDQQSRPKNLSPGESIFYSQDGKRIHLTSSNGIVIDANNQDVTINNAANVIINSSTEVILNTPVLKVSGDIIDNYLVNTNSVGQMRSIYNVHTHSDPQGSNTGVPNNLQ